MSAVQSSVQSSQVKKNSNSLADKSDDMQFEERILAKGFVTPNDVLQMKRITDSELIQIFTIFNTFSTCLFNIGV